MKELVVYINNVFDKLRFICIFLCDILDMLFYIRYYKFLMDILFYVE